MTADDTGEQVGTITTDENGVGTITGLIKQAYRFKKFKLQQAMFSQKNLSRDQSRMIWK